MEIKIINHIMSYVMALWKVLEDGILASSQWNLVSVKPYDWAS